jgi:DNA mismatch repair ATPase MutS
MDRFTIRNLELLGEGNNSLLKVLDNTLSPMGARLLKRWLVLPLTDINKIEERSGLVEFLIKSVDIRNKISQYIKQAGDVERLVLSSQRLKAIAALRAKTIQRITSNSSFHQGLSVVNSVFLNAKKKPIKANGIAKMV